MNESPFDSVFGFCSFFSTVKINQLEVKYITLKKDRQKNKTKNQQPKY